MNIIDRRKKIAPGLYVILAHDPCGFTVGVNANGEYEVIEEISYEEHGAETRGIARATFEAVCETQEVMA